MRDGQETEVFSEIVGAIYDASLDAERWTETLQLIGTFVPGCMVNLYAEETAPRVTSRFFTWGDDPAYTAAYLETYAPLNPLFPAGLFFPVGEIYATGDIMALEEMQASRFAREYLAPQGYVDFVASNLERTATACTMVTAVRHRDQGLTDAGAKRRMSLLVPHLRRAVSIGRSLRHAAVAIENLAAAADAVEDGIVLLNREGRIIHANRAALLMLEKAEVVRAQAGRIELLDPAARAALSAALRAAGTAEPSAGAVSLPLRTGAGEEWVADLLPLSRAGRRAAAPAIAATSALFLHRAAAALHSPAEIVARRYGLTAGELRVLIALAAGGGVAEVAQALGIGEATVRSHLLKLYGKTGTSRQSDLVRLLAAYAGAANGARSQKER